MRRTILLLATMALTLLVASGVALAVTKIGTNGNDVLRGTNGADRLVGKGGNDTLFALRGRDNLLGGEGKDVLVGGDERDPRGGDKNLAGGAGNDAVLGGQGSDNMVGDDGNDILVDGNLREFSRDNIVGGNGGDVINVSHRPAFRDVVACGGGFDWVIADRADVLAPDCERVKIVRGSSEAVYRQIDEFYESVPDSFFAGLQQ